MAKNSWKYSRDRQITQDSGSGNNWARGYHVHGPRCRDSILDVIRLEVAACLFDIVSELQSFVCLFEICM